MCSYVGLSMRRAAVMLRFVFSMFLPLLGMSFFPLAARLAVADCGLCHRAERMQQVRKRS